jgi:hypothetical protein
MTLKIQGILKGFAVVVIATAILFAGCGGSSSTTTDGSPSTNTNGAPPTTSNGNGIDKASGPAIGVSPSLITVKAGEEFEVNIVVKLPTPISAIGCQLKWTASDAAGTGKIECTEKIEQASFMTDNIGSVDQNGKFQAQPDSKNKPLMVGGQYDAMTGTSEPIALALIGEDTAAQGNGNVFTFHFKAVKPGEVTMEVYDVQIVDWQRQGVDAAIYSGKVVIE